ncbi:MAG: hypothetical protein ACI81P_001316, partial [Neolewinella sp.]
VRKDSSCRQIVKQSRSQIVWLILKGTSFVVLKVPK